MYHKLNYAGKPQIRAICTYVKYIKTTLNNWDIRPLVTIMLWQPLITMTSDYTNSKSFSRNIMWEFTRELDKEPLLYYYPIYTNVSWSVLPINDPALMSMPYPHSCLMSYSRLLCILHVPWHHLLDPSIMF